MNKYRVSIIIPVFNVEPYIEACLQSVANQTLTEGVECIVVDDCGTDQSMQIAEKFVQGYKGSIAFTILRHEHNQGLSAARNTGIRAAQGEYVYFLDSDDRIVPTCMENFIRIVGEHPKVDLIQGLLDQDSPYMQQFLTKSLPEYTEDRRYIKRALLDYDQLPVCAANKMVRRELLLEKGLFFKEGIIHEDNHWSFFLAKYVRSLAVYKERCYLYTENPSSITKGVSIDREIHSSRIIIEDFSRNIDSFLQGEQKTLIWHLFLQAVGSSYYHTEEEKKLLFQCLYKKCSFYEKPFMQFWYTLPNDSKLKARLVNFVIRLFRL